MTEERLREALKHETVPDEAGASERAWRIVAWRMPSAIAARRPLGPNPPASPGRWRPRGLIVLPDQPRRRRGSPLGAATRCRPERSHRVPPSPRSPPRAPPGANRRKRPVDRAGGRLEEVARRLWGGDLVAERPVRSCHHRHELVALDPAGEVRWSIARRERISAPTWNSPGRLPHRLPGRRLAEGDRRGRDRRSFAAAARRNIVEPAWRPGPSACCLRRSRRLRARGRGRQRPAALHTGPSRRAPVALAWSADGEG